MNREEIIAWAREAGIAYRARIEEFNSPLMDGVNLDDLAKFAALVADAEAKRIHDEGMVTVGHMREQIAAEREACAKLCEDNANDLSEGDWDSACITCADNIRAKGQA